MSNQQIVYVIDDDDALRDSVRLFLVNEGLSIKAYGSANEFLADLDALQSGCVVTDVRMPGMSGMDLLAHIAARGLSLPVVVITGHADVPLAVRAMKQGAIDLLEKPFKAEELIAAVRRGLALGKDAHLSSTPAEVALARRAMLSVRENEVLDRLIKGQPNKIIAYEMGISPRTVEVHRANVMKKTQAGSLSELIRMFLNAERS
ncbi:MAG TPA: response regulator FixJ [Roseiarcus sp.]|jgi:two-component system response regulator FixJ|nr:response regulator FixJ [Roseiarcus sp.]